LASAFVTQLPKSLAYAEYRSTAIQTKAGETMKLTLDILEGPPSAAQIRQARAAILRQLVMVALVFPISIAGIAFSTNLCTAPAYVAILIGSVMYLLYLTNDGQWLLFSYITPQQANMLILWAESNAAVALYSAGLRLQRRAPTDWEYRAIIRFVQAERKSA
jgi:signal transduction histidine kinase